MPQQLRGEEEIHDDFPWSPCATQKYLAGTDNHYYNANMTMLQSVFPMHEFFRNENQMIASAIQSHVAWHSHVLENPLRGRAKCISKVLRIFCLEIAAISSISFACSVGLLIVVNEYKSLK